MLRVVSLSARSKGRVFLYDRPFYRFVSDMALNNLTATQRALLPADKMDEDAVLHLHRVDEATIEPLIPELLTWIQDMNWPVAGVIPSLLLMHRRLLVAPVREILKGDDDAWKANCLRSLVEYMSQEQLLALKPEIERIANHPTPEEKVEEADETAGEILQEMQLWNSENTTAS